MKEDGGGPAFPERHYDLAPDEHGMSLRDYFAAKAMEAVIVGWGEDLNGDKVARLAYEYADRMLEARK